jgi:hypothetical protein
MGQKNRLACFVGGPGTDAAMLDGCAAPFSNQAPQRDLDFFYQNHRLVYFPLTWLFIANFRYILRHKRRCYKIYFREGDGGL